MVNWCNFRRYLTIIATFSVSLLTAQIDVKDIGSETIIEPKQGPFTLYVDFDAIGSSKINHGFYKGDKIRFAIADAELSGIFYYCPAYHEGANLSISYTYTTIEWHNNPWFNQNHFNTLSISLGGLSKRLYRWFWQGQMTINLDADHWNIDDYATYDLILWGRYTYCDHIGFHVGFIAQTGMQMDRVYPIIGADWRVSPNWKLNLVYPVNVSLEYLVNERWSLALAGRSFNTRYRIGKHEAFSKSVVRYENTGAEFAIKYHRADMTANIHAGTTLGGKFRVANRHNDHPHNYKLDPAGYVGAEVDVRF